MHVKTLVLVLMGLIALIALSITTGCGTLRFAPGEEQKQNAWLHQRTVQAAAIQAQREEASDTLTKLTDQASRQSDAMVAYFGFPQQPPATESIEDILSDQNNAITQQAKLQALQRPDPWDVADNLLELGIALAGVIGGVYGGKAVAGLKLAHQKSIALREIVTGNELFKKQNPDYAEAFKTAQGAQTPTTRNLVVANK